MEGAQPGKVLAGRLELRVATDNLNDVGACPHFLFDILQFSFSHCGSVMRNYVEELAAQQPVWVSS